MAIPDTSSGRRLSWRPECPVPCSPAAPYPQGHNVSPGDPSVRSPARPPPLTPRLPWPLSQPSPWPGMAGPAWSRDAGRPPLTGVYSTRIFRAGRLTPQLSRGPDEVSPELEEVPQNRKHAAMAGRQRNGRNYSGCSEDVKAEKEDRG